jgi:hypothetical protein
MQPDGAHRDMAKSLSRRSVLSVAAAAAPTAAVASECRIGPPVRSSMATWTVPEFPRQNRDIAAAVKAAGKAVQLIVQSLRNGGIHWQSLWSEWPRGVGDDESRCGMTKETLSTRL